LAAHALYDPEVGQMNMTTDPSIPDNLAAEQGTPTDSAKQAEKAREAQTALAPLPSTPSIGNPDLPEFRLNPLTGTSGVSPHKTPGEKRDKEGSPVSTEELSVGGIRPGTVNTANIGGWHVKRGDSTHPGLDLYAQVGTPVVASQSGRVLDVGYNKTAGAFVKVLNRHNKITTITGYKHLLGATVLRGQQVAAGQLIGYSGISGNGAKDYRGLSQQQHLHFEVNVGGTPLNPVQWLNGN
jgi:murein DD-endopeptidase MepM/ murein hydrolase activator NlpD